MRSSGLKLGRKKRIYKKEVIKTVSKKLLKRDIKIKDKIEIETTVDKSINHNFRILKYLFILTIPGSLLLFLINNYNYILVKAQDSSSESVLEVSDINQDINFVANSNSVVNKSLNEVPESNFKSLDKRIYVLDQYFKTRNSPLYGQANLFVEACDRFGAPKDCLTTAAIARHETDLCNYYNSAEMHNCMGWGGGGIYRTRFANFKDHIDVATDVLVNQYGIKYMIEPALMEKVFCGPDPECAGWGARVKQFMVEIDNYGESLGVGRLSELR
jgi:hypothetical protein